MAKTPTCPYCGAEMRMCRIPGTVYWMSCATCQEADTEQEAMDKAMRRESPWHSVEDGLPEHGTVCVVHGHNKRGVDCYDISMRGKTGWEFGALCTFEVERWMAVPDAPKEETTMRTPEEIKQGLQHCAGDGCEECNYESVCYGADGMTRLPGDALYYIMQLEAERDAMRTELDEYAGLCNICKRDKEPKPCTTTEDCAGCAECEYETCPCKMCYDTGGKKGYEWDGGAT